MARPLTLEDFSPGMPASQRPAAEPAVLTEEARLSAYEEGYKAGWDDAVEAESSTKARISADFEKTLQDLSFSFQEARSHVLRGVGPLLSMMAEKALPEMARTWFSATITEILRDTAEQAADRPVELVVNPENRKALEEVMTQDPALPMTLVEEPSLGPGQAFLRAASGETAIDIDAVLADIRTAVAGFLAADAHEDEEHKAHA